MWNTCCWWREEIKDNNLHSVVVEPPYYYIVRDRQSGCWHTNNELLFFEGYSGVVMSLGSLVFLILKYIPNCSPRFVRNVPRIKNQPWWLPGSGPLVYEDIINWRIIVEQHHICAMVLNTSPYEEEDLLQQFSASKISTSKPKKVLRSPRGTKRNTKLPPGWEEGS